MLVNLEKNEFGIKMKKKYMKMIEIITTVIIPVINLRQLTISETETTEKEGEISDRRLKQLGRWFMWKLLNTLKMLPRLP